MWALIVKAEQNLEVAMPYRFVEPELALEHKGILVYRAYKDDDADEPLRFWFALYPWGIEDNALRIEFDARTLKAWPKDEADHDVDSRRALKAAIDSGEIRIGIDNALAPYVTARRSEGFSLLSR
jgi:hypothetical protein